MAIRSFLITLVSLALLPAAVAQNPILTGYTYVTVQTTPLGVETECSATSIGPHALLTASHCEAPTDTLTISHNAEFTEEVTIVNRIRDKADHTIYLVAGNTPFRYLAKIGSTVTPQAGFEVFMDGAPGSQGPLYRTGVYSGKGAGSTAEGLDLFAVPVTHGDSGSALFNREGEIAWVISVVIDVATKPPSVWFAGALPLKFSEAELTKARAFKPAKSAEVARAIVTIRVVTDDTKR